MYLSPFPQIVLFELYWLGLLKDYSLSFSSKTSKMWNTQKTEVDPLIAEKDGYKVLLFACSTLDLKPPTRELNQQSVVVTLQKKCLMLTENNNLPSLFWWKMLGDIL